jgi:hypothetical protein
MGFSKEFCENVGKKITYKERRNNFPMSGVMVSCSEGGSATIKFVLDEPVEGSLEKYGEVLYKQIQIRYESNGEINDVVFEDLTEPQRRTEQDFFQQFLEQRVSFTTTDNKTITDVIEHVGPHGIYVKDNIKPNAIKMIMCLVWLYSWALFQFAKATEFFFRNLIRFPEQLFIFVDILCSQPKNIDDKSIHVLSAFNETGDITNRFKLFLWKYWNTTREIHDENGVDIGKFIKLFNCTMLYCSYLLKDSSNLDQEYEQQVKRMLITKQEVKGKFQRFTKKDLKFTSVSSSRDSQKSHDIINDEFLHDIIMEDANNELQSKETNLLFSHCTF